MLRRALILFVPLLIAGCGIKGPLYLPPDPSDSYLSRLQKAINDMTDSQTVAEQPPEEKVQIDLENLEAPKAFPQTGINAPHLPEAQPVKP